MAETLGQIVDKLSIVNLKMWHAQTDLYEIRHMTFEQFKEKFGTEEGLKNMWEIFKKALDLNIQRNELIYELDKKFADSVYRYSTHFLSRDQIFGELTQNPHKTY